MILYPAIDLYAGKAVRLRQGRYDEMTVYHEDPAELAHIMKSEGADHLHLVDLEGARDGNTPNQRIIEAIASIDGLFLMASFGKLCVGWFIGIRWHLNALQC